MPTDTIIPVSGGFAVARPAEPVDNPGALLDRDAFLTLLVTQLKYQDPANPADTSQLLTQSAQLTMVDRLNEIADAMSEASAIDRITLAGSMIGRDISFRADDGTVRTERVHSVLFEAGVLTIRAGDYSVPLDAIVEMSAATVVSDPVVPDPGVPPVVVPPVVVPDVVVPPVVPPVVAPDPVVPPVVPDVAVPDVVAPDPVVPDPVV